MKVWWMLVGLGTLLACKAGDRQLQKKYKDVADPQISFEAGAPTLVYKTRGNYDRLVPVLLSEDKVEIVSYPHPKDVMVDGQLAYPTPLEKGYRLDNRGIDLNVAFLKLTYEEYAALDQAPSLAELYSLLKDTDPLEELCYCGYRYNFVDLKGQLNKLIVFNRLRTDCEVMK
jgi:hypothetical protein